MLLTEERFQDKAVVRHSKCCDFSHYNPELLHIIPAHYRTYTYLDYNPMQSPKYGKYFSSIPYKANINVLISSTMLAMEMGERIRGEKMRGERK